MTTSVSEKGSAGPSKPVDQNGIEPKPTEIILAPLEPHWPSVLYFIYLNLGAVWGFMLAYKEGDFVTPLIAVFFACLAILGVTAGAHRLWAHRSYTASWPLRLFLMLTQTLAGQGTIYEWVRGHRLHHKFYETELDPFDPRRGFFFTHVGARLVKQDPRIYQKAKEIDLSDLEEDAVIMFQKKFYWLLMPILFLIFPIYIPYAYLGESFMKSFFIAGAVRYSLSLNLAWLINSGCFIWGLRPGEKFPSESNWDFFIARTFWPRYHYLIPRDYKTNEFGGYGNGLITWFIELAEKMGHVTNLKTTNEEMMKKSVEEAVQKQVSIVDCLARESIQDLPENSRKDYYDDTFKKS